MTAREFDLETFIPFRLHTVSEAVSQSFRTVYRNAYGMTRSEWRVFAQLGQFGAMTATEIGQSASLHKTKVSRAVYALEQRRWLARNQDDRDRRVQILSLTRSGLAAYRELGSQAQLYNARLAGQLGSHDVAALLALLEKLNAAVSESEKR